MAAGDSSTSICNIALIALGEDPITDLSDNTKRAILCRIRYDDIRRFVLRSHPWGCAVKQDQWAADPVGPLFTWLTRFALPSDFIRFYGESSDYDMSIWKRMGDYIYTNETAPLDVLYVYDLQDATKMDAAMVHVIAYNIVTELGMAITQNPSRVQFAIDMIKGKYDIARFIGSQENAPKEWDVDVLLRSRN